MAEATVYVVDDDQALRDALGLLMRSVGLRVACFSRSDEFLEQWRREHRGCLVLDIRMPGMGGLELQARLKEQGSLLPVIVITGHGDVPLAVRALKAGAVEFLEKPFNDQVLLDNVMRAMRIDAQQAVEAQRRDEIQRRLDQLTPREREVLGKIIAGRSNREMAAEMGVSQKTIEAHRSRVMEKSGAGSLSELVQMVLASASAVAADEQLQAIGQGGRENP